MAKTKKEDETVVHAPPKPITDNEKKIERDKEKDLESERFGVLQISQKVGKYFSASMLAAGLLLLCTFTYAMITGDVEWITALPEMPFLTYVCTLTIWIFTGIINIIGGLLLMGSE